MPERQTIDDLVAEIERRPDTRAARKVLELIEQVYAISNVAKVKKKDLAARMGVSQSRVSQMLNGSPNITLTTFYRLADALGTIDFADMTLDKRRYPACFHAVTSESTFEEAITDQQYRANHAPGVRGVRHEVA